MKLPLIVFRIDLVQNWYRPSFMNSKCWGNKRSQLSICPFPTVIKKSTAGDRTGNGTSIWCDSRLTLFMQIWKPLYTLMCRPSCRDTLTTSNVFAARGLKANTSWSITSFSLYCHSLLLSFSCEVDRCMCARTWRWICILSVGMSREKITGGKNAADREMLI